MSIDNPGAVPNFELSQQLLKGMIESLFSSGAIPKEIASVVERVLTEAPSRTTSSQQSRTEKEESSNPKTREVRTLVQGTRREEKTSEKKEVPQVFFDENSPETPPDEMAEHSILRNTLRAVLYYQRFMKTEERHDSFQTAVNKAFEGFKPVQKSDELGKEFIRLPAYSFEPEVENSHEKKAIPFPEVKESRHSSTDKKLTERHTVTPSQRELLSSSESKEKTKETKSRAAEEKPSFSPKKSVESRPPQENLLRNEPRKIAEPLVGSKSDVLPQAKMQAAFAPSRPVSEATQNPQNSAPVVTGFVQPLPRQPEASTPTPLPADPQVIPVIAPFTPQAPLSYSLKYEEEQTEEEPQEDDSHPDQKQKKSR